MRRSLVFPKGLLLLAASAACGASPPPAEGRGFAELVQAASERPLVAGFVVVDGVYTTELTAPWDVLQHSVYHAEHGVEVFSVSPDGGLVTTAEGLKIQPDHSHSNSKSRRKAHSFKRFSFWILSSRGKRVCQ